MNYTVIACRSHLTGALVIGEVNAFFFLIQISIHADYVHEYRSGCLA